MSLGSGTELQCGFRNRWNRFRLEERRLIASRDETVCFYAFFRFFRCGEGN